MSDLSADEVEALRRVLLGLGTHKSEFIVVGGWAHRLMRRHPLARVPGFSPLLTTDLDLAGPHRLGHRGDMTLADSLKAQGFFADCRTDDRPPVTHYVLDQPPLQLEFIAPIVGSGRRRDGSAIVTESLCGVSAQKIRHLELLRVEPWPVALPEVDKGAEAQVANPVAFMVQKLLSAPDRRDRAKKGKDFLYLYDTAVLFFIGPRLHPALVEQAARVRNEIPRKARERLRDHQRRFFGPVVTDELREAGRIAAQSGRSAPPTADQIHSTCVAAFAELMP